MRACRLHDDCEAAERSWLAGDFPFDDAERRCQARERALHVLEMFVDYCNDRHNTLSGTVNVETLESLQLAMHDMAERLELERKEQLALVAVRP